MQVGQVLDGGFHLGGIILMSWSSWLLSNKELNSKSSVGWSRVAKMLPKVAPGKEAGRWLEAGRRGIPGLFRPNQVEARVRSGDRRRPRQKEESLYKVAKKSQLSYFTYYQKMPTAIRSISLFIKADTFYKYLIRNAKFSRRGKKTLRGN